MVAKATAVADADIWNGALSTAQRTAALKAARCDVAYNTTSFDALPQDVQAALDGVDLSKFATQ